MYAGKNIKYPGVGSRTRQTTNHENCKINLKQRKGERGLIYGFKTFKTKTVNNVVSELTNFVWTHSRLS